MQMTTEKVQNRRAVVESIAENEDWNLLYDSAPEFSHSNRMVSHWVRRDVHTWGKVEGEYFAEIVICDYKIEISIYRFISDDVGEDHIADFNFYKYEDEIDVQDYVDVMGDLWYDYAEDFDEATTE